MGKEIEKKFLLKNDDWKKSVKESFEIKQGYLSIDPDRTVRARLIGDKAFLTIKGKTEGITREEFEYPIPVSEANAIISTLAIRPIIEKTRHVVVVNGIIWEIDEFHGDNQGLLLAEVELTDASQIIDQPSWAGQEVSQDDKYYNSNLIKMPFTQW